MSDKKIIYADDAINAVLSVIPNDGYWNERAKEAVKHLLPAHPELETGEWIPYTYVDPSI